MAMKRTPLYEEHVAASARMIEFAGWEMPVFYSGINEEHLAVRSSAGLFDVSHMGDVFVRGKEAEALLSHLLTNEVRSLPLGKAVYAHVLNDVGKIMDDTIVYRLEEEEYLLVPNASTTSMIVEWIKRHQTTQMIDDVSARVSCLALQGPKAMEILRELLGEAVTRIKHFHCQLLPCPEAELKQGIWPGRVLVSRTGYTGEEGFELLVDNKDAVRLWRRLFQLGARHGLRPIGLGARDTLRLEMGYLLSGTDFDGSQSSLQTGPEWVVKWDHEFIGRQALLEESESCDRPKLAGVELLGKGIPRHGYALRQDGTTVGQVTSGTLSPSLKRGIALAYLPPALGAPGTRLEMAIRETLVPAVVVKTPFLRR